MADPRLRVAAWFGLAAGLAAACGHDGSEMAGGRGGASGGGAAGGTPAAAGTGGDAGAAGAGGATCEPAPKPLRAAGTILELPVDLVYDGHPFIYGEPNMLASNLTVTPLNLRFYLSSVELLTAAGASVPVDVVTSGGSVQPYDLFLFNADDAGAQTLRVLAPPGAYTGVKLALGMSPACDGGSPAGRDFPLSDASQMTWPHLAGYLFLRYESQVGAPDPSADAGGTSSLPLAVHMGADIRDLSAPAALVFRVQGSISIPATGSVSRHLRLAIDQVLKGAASDVDVSYFPAAILGPEAVAGERLRLTGASLPLFELAP